MYMAKHNSSTQKLLSTLLIINFVLSVFTLSPLDSITSLLNFIYILQTVSKQVQNQLLMMMMNSNSLTRSTFK